MSEEWGKANSCYSPEDITCAYFPDWRQATEFLPSLRHEFKRWACCEDTTSHIVCCWGKCYHCREMSFIRACSTIFHLRRVERCLDCHYNMNKSD